MSDKIIRKYGRKEYRVLLKKLQTELVAMQRWVQDHKKRVVILFEGRDTAGKGGAIFRFTQYLNPRTIRIVALSKPTDQEKGQWYFQRYIKELPNPGEIVFFDRSWYNRAVVEPVMGFCNQPQYELFMQQTPEFEKMLADDGIILIKLWFSINIEEQKKRLEERQTNPLKQWKLSTIDLLAQQKWNDFTRYKDEMFRRTSNEQNPWVIVKGNDKPTARLEAIKYVLSQIPYEGRPDEENFLPDKEIVLCYSDRHSRATYEQFNIRNFPNNAQYPFMTLP